LVQIKNSSSKPLTGISLKVKSAREDDKNVKQDRQKKDHKRKDKENKAMKERGKRRKQVVSPRHLAKDEYNLTNSEAGPDTFLTGRPLISGVRNS
jgi:hypothetical protein